MGSRLIKVTTVSTIVYDGWTEVVFGSATLVCSRQQLTYPTSANTHDSNSPGMGVYTVQQGTYTSVYIYIHINTSVHQHIHPTPEHLPDMRCACDGIHKFQRPLNTGVSAQIFYS